MASESELMSEKARGVEPAQPGEVRIRRALLSVSDKRGLVELARGLRELDVEIVSTGGSARELSEAGIEVRAIEDYTGFPEIMDGRVKTINPRLYAGLLARRDDEGHLRQAAEHEIEQVDLVCVNLYPFEETIAKPGASDAEAIENIDIGGPTMIRAAAKNSDFAAVLTTPPTTTRCSPSCVTAAAGSASRPGAVSRRARSRRPPATTRRSRPGSRRANRVRRSCPRRSPSPSRR